MANPRVFGTILPKLLEYVNKELVYIYKLCIYLPFCLILVLLYSQNMKEILRQLKRKGVTEEKLSWATVKIGFNKTVGIV